MIKRRKKEKKGPERNPKNFQRTSIHILATPDPIPGPITPSTQPVEWKWPMGQSL